MKAMFALYVVHEVCNTIIPKKCMFLNLKILCWWSNGWDSACQCRGHGFHPWSRRIPRVMGQLNLWAPTIEPSSCNYWSPHRPRAHALQQEKPPQWETLTLQLESSPHSDMRESPCVAMRTLCSQKGTSEKNNYWYFRTSLVAQTVKNLPAMQKTWVQFLCWEDSLEEGMATHSRILAWRIPWTEKPGRLQSMGLQRQTRLSD